MFSAKQGQYWYHFYNVFGFYAVLDWGLNLGPPALEASSILLGYRGGGNHTIEEFMFNEGMKLTYNFDHSADVGELEVV